MQQLKYRKVQCIVGDVQKKLKIVHHEADVQFHERADVQLQENHRDPCCFRKRKGFYICPGLPKTEDRIKRLDSVRNAQWGKLCREVSARNLGAFRCIKYHLPLPCALLSLVLGWVSSLSLVRVGNQHHVSAQGPVVQWLSATGHQPPPAGLNMGLGCGFLLSLKLSVSLAYWAVTSPKPVGARVSEIAAPLQWSWKVAKESLHSPDRKTGETESLQKPCFINKNKPKAYALREEQQHINLGLSVSSFVCSGRLPPAPAPSFFFFSCWSFLF